MIIGARFDLMALNAWTLERQATADSSRRTAVAARPIIKPQSLRPNGVCVEAWARSIAMKKAYHKFGVRRSRRRFDRSRFSGTVRPYQSDPKGRRRSGALQIVKPHRR
jgi:hypothetical protein